MVQVDVARGVDGGVTGDGGLARLLALDEPQHFSLMQMQAWGEALGARLPLNCVVTLNGDLGAGKTTLARAICVGAGVRDVNAVTSPTFAIVHQYDSVRGLIVHADLYRLKGDTDLDAIGWDELISAAALTLVEWPERATRSWPRGAIAVAIADSGAEARRVTVRAL